MSSSMRMGLHGYLPVLGIFVLACGDGATTTAPPNAAVNRGASVPVNFAAAKSQVVPCVGSVSTGSIVYTTGTIHVCNLSAGSDKDLGVSGVNPKVSPDGTLITYQTTSGQNQGIYVMFSTGTGKKRVSSSGGMPSFNPAGSKIAFGNNGIYTMGVNDLLGTATLIPGTVGGLQPAWSPDGSQIAYNAAVAGKGQQLFMVNVDGTNAHQALTSGSVIDVVWRPSAKILFGMQNASYDLYSYDPNIPTSLTRLTTGTNSDFEPSWSPDGSQIAWTSLTSGKTAGIWVMNADGTSKQGPVISKGRQGSWGR